jgi:hypothetical protein
MLAYLRKLWRRLLGKHPVYEWGASSAWGPWISAVNRTIQNYIDHEAEQVVKDLEKHAALKRLLKTSRIRMNFDIDKK